MIEFIPLQGKTTNKSTKPPPSVAPSALSEVSGGVREGAELKGTAMLMFADKLVLRVRMLAGRKLCHICCFHPRAPMRDLMDAWREIRGAFAGLQISA